MKKTEFIIKSLSFIFGLFFITVIIWNRFFRIREDIFITQNNSSIKIIFVCITLICFIIVLLITIKNLLNLPPKETSLFQKFTNIPLIVTCINYYTKIIIKGPETVFELFFKYINIRTYIEDYGSYLIVYLEKHYLFYYIILFIIPRTIIILTLFIDVVIFHQFNLINKVIFIAVVPLFTRFILFAINYCGESIGAYLNRFFDYTYDPNEDIIYITYNNLTSSEDLKIQQNADMEYVEWLYIVHGEHIRVIREFYEVFDRWKYIYRVFLFTILIITTFIQLMLLLNINCDDLLIILIDKDNPFSGMNV